MLIKSVKYTLVVYVSTKIAKRALWYFWAGSYPFKNGMPTETWDMHTHTNFDPPKPWTQRQAKERRLMSVVHTI